MVQNDKMPRTMNKKTLTISAKTLCVGIAMMVLLQSAGHAQEAKLANIIVTNTRDNLLVYMNVEGAFTEEVKQAVLSGVPVSFSFFVELDRNQDFWPDEAIVSEKITHTVKYNNLKKEFLIERSWETGDPVVTKSFEHTKKLMTEVDSWKVVQLDRLEKGSRYQLRAKAELSKRTLPFYLHYVLFFVSMWDFETDWYTIDFIY